MSTTAGTPPVDELAKRRELEAQQAELDRVASRRDAAGDDHVDDVDDEVTPAEPEAQLALPGIAAGGPLDMRVGRGRPTDSTFAMRSIGLPLGGQLELDGKVWLLVEADVDDVGVRSHRKGRTITGRTRRHVVTPLSVRVLDVAELKALGVETSAA